MDRFTISLNEDLAEQFDELIRQKGYQNRSEAVRDILRTELLAIMQQVGAPTIKHLVPGMVRRA